jgi:hypothetical protein
MSALHTSTHDLPTSRAKRDALRKLGEVFVVSASLPVGGLLAPHPARAAVWVVPAATFLLGYGFDRLYRFLQASGRAREEERLRDRLGAFNWPNRNDQRSLDLFLGPTGAKVDATSQLAWPEFGYHHAKLRERAGYRHPASPREPIAGSDIEIFEAAVKAKLANRSQAYARDYRDLKGNTQRIVAARQPDGQVWVAESDGRDAVAYEIHVQRG